MSRLVIETRGLWDWQSRLADPVKQWKRGYSAYELAVSWERAAALRTDIPPEVLSLLEQRAEFSEPGLIVAIVEHTVPLKHGNTASQNDVWALVRVGQEMLSLAIEGKAGEDFDKLVSQWLKEKKEESSKPDRLDYLLRILGIPGVDVLDVRYQLLHRTASALIEAERLGAKYAAMVVQEFPNPQRKGDPRAQLEDFKIFGRKLGVTVEEGKLVHVPGQRVADLYLGWVACTPATDEEIAALTWNGGRQELLRKSRRGRRD